MELAPIYVPGGPTLVWLEWSHADMYDLGGPTLVVLEWSYSDMYVAPLLSLEWSYAASYSCTWQARLGEP